MEFLDISSLDTTYQYVVKIEQKLKKRRDNLGLGIPHSRSRERAAQTHRTKEKENMGNLRTTIPSHKKIRTKGRRRNILRCGATSIRAPGTTLLIVDQSSHLWLR
jgi:cellulose biosynthesis protein BcsQ